MPLFVLSGSLARAVQNPVLPGFKISKPPMIDGKIEPGEWEGAPLAKGFVDAFTGKPTSDDTEARIAYDDQAIYVSLYARESKPDEIVGREIKPGSEFSGEDILIFTINPQGTKTWDGRCVFRVNPLNTQNEVISGGRAAKREWRGEWTSATSRVADGWCAEFRIPWKMLNYPGGANRSMDINFKRYQARTNIEFKWADTTVQEKQDLNGVWTGINPPRPAAPKPSFLAYTAPEVDDGKFGLRSGLDIRYPFTSQMTGLLSINPDFKNIESQIEGIQFSRTERFLDEARPFFNEGGDHFEIGGGQFGFGQMFYSRRINSMDWGAKTYGNITPTLSVGALTAVDSGRESSNIVRISNNFAPRRYGNVWFTESNRYGKSSQASGFSGNYGMGNYGLSLNLGTSKHLTSASPVAGDASFSYEVPHWFAEAKYQWIPPGFSSPLGYIPWTNRRGGYFYVEHNNQYRQGPIKRFHAESFSNYYEEYGGAQQQKGTELYSSISTRSDLGFGAGISRFTFYGEREDTQNVRVTINESNRYKRFGIHHNWGERNGRDTRYTSLDASYRLLPGLDLGVSWSLFNFVGEDRLTVGTVSYELGPLDSISGRFVNRNGDVNAYMAYRHSGGKGVEYFVIIGDPNAEKWRSRVSLKVVFAF